MHVEWIKLYNFRNLADQTLDLSPTINIVVGDNGHGKTNLVEAINLLNITTSFRTSKARDMIAWGKRECSVFAHVMREVSDCELGVSFTSKEQRVYVNQEQIKLIREFIGHLVCVSFSPSDLELVSGAPQARRQFMDKHLVDLSPQLIDVVLRYQKALKSKNALLKQGTCDREILDAWNVVLAECGGSLVKARLDFAHELAGRAVELYHKFAPDSERLDLELVSDFLDEGNCLTGDALHAVLRSQVERDIEQGNAGHGPHRDELRLNLKQHAARSFASQGQARSVVLALKLAVIHLIQERLGDTPVLLLDDVDSELDPARSESLFELIQSQQRQVIITATTAKNFKFLQGSGAILHRVEDGRVSSQPWM